MTARIIGTAFAGVLWLASMTLAADTFNESDDYQEGEEVVNVFLKEPDYRLMVEDLERSGASFDWGWVLTPAADAALKGAAAEAPARGLKGLKGRMFKHSKLIDQQPRELAFNITTYGTIAVPPVQNFGGLVDEEFLEAIRSAFVRASKALSLNVVENEPAALKLEIALVDVNRDWVNVMYANVPPSIELEIRLSESATGRNLVLLRNQEHNGDLAQAALDYAEDFMKLVR